MKQKIIFSHRLMEYLLQKGFCQIGMMAFDGKPDKSVYFFIDSPELEAAIKNYYR